MGRPKAPCGTDAAYRRHLREGVEVDEACRRAHTEAGRKSSGRKLPRFDAPAVTTEPVEPPSDQGDEPDDMKLIVDTLRTVFKTVAEKDPTRIAPIARVFQTAVEATRGPVEPPKELTLADQLAQVRAARAARTAGKGATA
ncbi:hypothetical protein [uncultured Microbacterium sp.]|jgi:hypothetical protein|uniref:hypothetical protein n=1 Tax=Microbacterium algeriense TaxID=2615184 RepID=UPI002595715E|nr:hypothetical protein [uncultured Microbacterium sp.]